MKLFIVKSASDFRPQYKLIDADAVTTKKEIKPIFRDVAEKENLEILGAGKFPWLVLAEVETVENDGTVEIFNYSWQAEKMKKQLEA